MVIQSSTPHIPTVWFKRNRSAITALEVAQLLHLINAMGHRTDGTHTLIANEIAYYQDSSEDNYAILQLNETRNTLTITEIQGNVLKLPEILQQFGLVHSIQQHMRWSFKTIRETRQRRLQSYPQLCSHALAHFHVHHRYQWRYILSALVKAGQGP